MNYPKSREVTEKEKKKADRYKKQAQRHGAKVRTQFPETNSRKRTVPTSRDNSPVTPCKTFRTAVVSS